MTKIPEIIPAKFKYVTTRKEHSCEGCSNTIKKGIRCLYVGGKIGRFFSEYFCDGCDLDRINGIPDKILRRKILVARSNSR